MQIILSEDVPKLGRAGEIKKVSDGYARNFLFPRKLALPSSPSNLKRLEVELKKREIRRAVDLESAKWAQEQLEKISLVFHVRAGREGHLFGSVSSQRIAQALQEKGFTVDKKNILLSTPIKALGEYEVSIKLHSEIITSVKIHILAASSSEEMRQVVPSTDDDQRQESGEAQSLSSPEPLAVHKTLKKSDSSS